MSDARMQLESLLKMQELALEIQAARAIIEGAPGRLDEVENRFRERNAEYVATRERFDAIEADRRARSLELASLEETRRHYQDSLMQVKNQREYSAVLKEIDAAKARIGEHEEAILATMEEVETLQSDLEARAAHIDSERAVVETERAAIAADVAEAEARVERGTAERRAIEQELPAALVANVRRVEEGRRGIFLVKAEREMCSACHVRLRPQVYQEIRQATQVHICGNCRRYLYFEPALTSSGRPPATSAGSEVEAVNGGAV